MTARELITLLLDYPLDRPLYVGKGMGPLVNVNVTAGWIILAPEVPDAG